MIPETKTPEPQTVQTLPERQLTPKQLQDQILHETLRRYGVDIKDFIQESTSCCLDTLRTELESPEQLSLEQKVQAVYREYISQELQQEGGIEKTANLESITNSVDSERIVSLKEEFEKIITPVLEKYTFLDTQTQNFIKLGIVNAMLKSPLSEIADSLISGVGNFFGKLSQIDPNDVNSLANAFKSTPEDSGRSVAFEEKFIQILSSYTQKFDEIEKFFTEKNITNPQEKQNIISYIDWFRNPALIEAGVNGLDMSQLNIQNKDNKNEAPLDVEALAEYMANSREKIVELSKKLQLGDKAGDMIYSMINVGGNFGDSVQKITEMILKIPFLGKFFALLLGLNSDPNKAIKELRENSKNFKILSVFQGLGIRKDNQGNTTNGTEPFADINLSEINFNASKKEIQSIKPFITSDKDEDIKNFWLGAFGDGIQKDRVTLKFDMTDTHKQDKKITTQEFKEMIKTGLSDYNSQKETQRIEAEATQRGLEEAETKRRIQELNQTINNLNSQIENVDSILNKSYERIRHWDDWLNVGDINDIKTQDMINHTGNNFNSIIEATLKTGSLDDFSDSDLQLLNQLFIFIKDYCQENSLSNQGEIKGFLKNNETGFHSWLGTKKTDLIQQRDGKQDDLAPLQGNQEKLNFARSIGNTITNLNNEASLLGGGIDLGGNKKLSFNKENQELQIGDEKFKIYGIDAILNDIVINGDKIRFKGSRFGITGNQEINRSTFIHGLQELVLKGSYEFTGNDGKTIKIEKV